MSRGRNKHRRDIGSDAPLPPVKKPVALVGLDAWRMIRLIGAGSHGTVYEVEHRTRPGRRAALKILNHLLQEDRAKSRFKQEADAAKLVRHPNVVEVFDYDITADGKCYLLMELLDGRSLDQLDLPLPLRQALSIGAHVAAALSAAHAHGVVHRDVKPQNILLCRESTGRTRVKLLDFGIAKLLDPEQSSLKTATGERLGTPAYMAPEQWRCLREIDGRADVYALGITLYELLVGRQPFQASSDYDWGLIRDKQELPQTASFLKLPREVRALILRMVQKDREKRPQSMSEVAFELRKLSEALYEPLTRTSHSFRYSTIGTLLLLVSFIGLTGDIRVEDDPSAVMRLVPSWTGNQRGISADQQGRFGEDTGQGAEDSLPEKLSSGSLSRVPALPALPVVADLDESRSMTAVENRRTGWGSVWPGFTNARKSKLQSAARGGGSQSHDGLQVRLVWRIPPPAPTTSLRISSGGRSILPNDVVLAGNSDEAWFHYSDDTLTLDPAVLRELPGALLFEARNEFGCLLAVGNFAPDEVGAQSTYYVSLDTPSRAEFLDLKVERKVLPVDGTMQPGVLLVEDGQRSPLIDCGFRCQCWIPRGTSLHFVGLGGERTPFAQWSIPSCKEGTQCVVSEAELRAAPPDGIVGTFLSWQQLGDGWETLQPPPITLNPELQRYYRTREHEEYANPTQLRAVTSSSIGSFWLAGRGGILMKWDGLLRSFARNQVGDVDPAAPRLPCEEFGCMVGRTTDLYAVSQQRDGISYSVGHKEFRGREARATAFRFDGERWTPTAIVSSTAATSGLPELGTMKTLLSVWSSPVGNRTVAVGYGGGIVDSAVGVVPNYDLFTRSLWSVTGNEAGWVLMAGSSNQPGKGPIVMMMEPGGTPVVLDSLRTIDDRTIPNVTLRSAWLSPDGRDIWLGGLSGPLFQYERDEHGQLLPTTVCEKGALSIRILSMWGTSRSNVWAASRNRVLHCDGANPWTIRHIAPVGVELTGIAGDPSGEIWVVGFYKAPDQNFGLTGPSDFAYVARLRPENRHRIGESLLPQSEAVSEQSTDQPERAVH